MVPTRILSLSLGLAFPFLLGAQNLEMAGAHNPPAPSSAGVKMLWDLYPGGFSSDPIDLTEVNGKLVFRARSENDGYELWIADVPDGPVVKKDINPNRDSGGSIAFLAKAGGRLFFVADDGIHGLELWSTDGTLAGTTLARDINPGLTSPTINEWIVHKGQLFFSARTPELGVELWKSDGTEAGTVPVKDIVPGWDGSWPRKFVIANDQLLFLANDKVRGEELWGTDGTEAGTRCLKDIGPGSRQAYHRFLGVAGTRLFFAADDYVHGSEMWVSDGTEAGTYLVKDIAPGNTSSGPVNMTNHNGVLFFYASDTVGMTGHGTELWKSDGTEAGTVMVKDISPGPESTDFFFSGLQSRDAFDLNGRIFFTAADRTGAYPGKFGRELYITDGTEGGTSLVKDIWPGTGGSSVRFVCIENNRLIFRADDFLHGEELWSSDGTPSGTVLLKDINLGESDTKITVLAHTNGWLFFTAYDPVNQGALWKSDGTEAGTQPLKSHIVYPDTISSFFVSPVYYDSQLYFVAGTEATGYELCVTDGTQEGTKVVDEVHPGNSSGVLGGSLFNLGDAIYFAAGDGIHGEELWIHEPALFRVRLKNPKLMTAGRIQFEIESTAKGTVHIQRSSDTRNWTPVDQVIVTDLSKPLTWSETPRIEGTGLFYRALLEW